MKAELEKIWRTDANLLPLCCIVWREMLWGWYRRGSGSNLFSSHTPCDCNWCWTGLWVQEGCNRRWLTLHTQTLHCFHLAPSNRFENLVSDKPWDCLSSSFVAVASVYKSGRGDEQYRQPFTAFRGPWMWLQIKSTVSEFTLKSSRAHSEGYLFQRNLRHS